MTVIYILSTTRQPAFGSKRRSKLDDDHEQEADFIDVLLGEMEIDPTMEHIKALIVVLLNLSIFISQKLFKGPCHLTRRRWNYLSKSKFKKERRDELKIYSFYVWPRRATLVGTYSLLNFIIYPLYIHYAVCLFSFTNFTL